MGNENSSMCGCYDTDAERLKAESNAFAAHRPDLQTQEQKKLQMEKFSQYSYGQSYRENTDRSARNNSQNTFQTSYKKSNYGYIPGQRANGPPSLVPNQQDYEMIDPQATRVQGLLSTNQQSMKYHYDGRQDGTTGSQIDQFSARRGSGYKNKFNQYEDEGMKLRHKQASLSPTRDVEMQAATSHYAQPTGYQSARSNNSFASSELKTKKVPQGDVKIQKKRTLHINDYKKFKRINHIENRYAFGKTLGQGAFGVVRLCMHKDSGKTFAIKIMQKRAIEKQQIYVQLLQNELSILGEKSHPNIIRIVDLIEDNDNYYVVSELVKGGELFKRLTKVSSFTESQAVDIIHQIMLGLNYMHLQSITHRDMKPENILLVSDDMDNFDIKIADLGFAQKFDKETGLDLVLGTPLYMAPELVMHQKYSEKVDVWSMGVITYQLLCGKTPFDGKNIKKINQYICQKDINFSDKCWRNISDNAKDFILCCLNKDQFQRASIHELFDHPWICEVPEAGSQDEEVQLNIQKNLIQYQTCSEFQKIVLSLVSGLSATQEELTVLQREFLRLDKDKSGTLNKWELEQMTNSKLCQSYELDWDDIITACDYNGDGVIDFQEFISACIDRKVLNNKQDVKVAFRILDTNKDGTITLEDFDDLFNSYGGSKMDQEVWENLLAEADKNGDNKVSFEEFQEAMANMLRKSINKKRRHTKN